MELNNEKGASIPEGGCVAVGVGVVRRGEAEICSIRKRKPEILFHGFVYRSNEKF